MSIKSLFFPCTLSFRSENQTYDAEIMNASSALNALREIRGHSSTDSNNRHTISKDIIDSVIASATISSSSSSSSSNSFSVSSPLKLGQSYSSEKNLSDPVLPVFQDVYLCDTCDKDFDSFGSLLVRYFFLYMTNSVFFPLKNRAFPRVGIS